MNARETGTRRGGNNLAGRCWNKKIDVGIASPFLPLFQAPRRSLIPPNHPSYQSTSSALSAARPCEGAAAPRRRSSSACRRRGRPMLSLRPSGAQRARRRGPGRPREWQGASCGVLEKRREGVEFGERQARKRAKQEAQKRKGSDFFRQTERRLIFSLRLRRRLTSNRLHSLPSFPLEPALRHSQTHNDISGTSGYHF